jgi:ATP/maltotriose-dependent transcriptional regulator MalT
MPDLAEARGAFAGFAWDRVRELLVDVAHEDESGEALELLATAAWWLDDGETARGARERLFRMRRAAADDAGAARVAIDLAWDATIFRSDTAVARGWAARARRLLEGMQPRQEHAWLALREASLDRAAPAVFAAARAIARQVMDVDAEMTALALEGNALIAEGRVADGLGLMDEATAAACAGELEHPIAITFACCQQLGACSRVGDYDRATQWCNRIAPLCDERNIWSILSVSRCFYAPILIRRGLYREAEEILAKATTEYADLIPSHALMATAWLAELRLRQGRPADARRLLDAAEPDVTARITRSALALAAGEVDDAVEQARAFLRQAAVDRHVERATALELIARGEAARGRLQEAESAIASLSDIARELDTVPLTASVLVASAALDMAAGVPAAAHDRLVDAVDLFDRGHAPYEAAQAMFELARVYVALDRPADARRERARGDARLRELRREADPGPLTIREREVLGLVAAGFSNPEIGAQLVLSTHTVHRHLANIMRKLGGCGSRVVAVARARELGVLP